MHRKTPWIRQNALKEGIKPLVNKRIRNFDIVAFDTETKHNSNPHIENKTVSLQVKMNRDAPKIIYNLDKSIKNLEHLLGNNKLAFCTAHNLEFDLSSLIGAKNTLDLSHGKTIGGWFGLVRVGNKSSFAILQNPSIKKRITLTDTLNFASGTLGFVSKTKLKGMEKGKKPKDLGVGVAKTPLDLLEFEEYALQDVEIQHELTRKIVDFFINTNVSLSATVPSLSGKVFRRNYLQKPLRFNLSKDDIDLMYNSYHGGRWEAYGRGFFEGVKMYDINSNFPASATMVPLNFSNSAYSYFPLDDYLDKEVFGYLKVKFSFPEDTVYPCLPVKKDVGKSSYMSVYPLSGTTYCSSVEAIEAIRLGCELELLDDRGWKPTERDWVNPIREFMLDCYKKRKEDSFISYKLLMNSFIGKLAQTYVENNRLVAGDLFRPDFASLILGQSRVMASKLINDCNAIYLGCDGVFTRSRLPTSSKLGALKEVYPKKKKNVLVVRNRLYMMEREGVNESDRMLKLLRASGESPVVESERERMISLKQSYLYGCHAHKMVVQPQKLSILSDGKRDYFDDLNSAALLATNHTMSVPFKKF